MTPHLICNCLVKDNLIGSSSTTHYALQRKIYPQNYGSINFKLKRHLPGLKFEKNAWKLNNLRQKGHSNLEEIGQHSRDRQTFLIKNVRIRT